MHKNDRETIISSLERVKLKKTLLNALNDEKIENLHEILKVFIPIFEKNNEIIEDNLHFDCECFPVTIVVPLFLIHLHIYRKM